MHIHILGICGSFMGGVAALAKAAGHTVTGSDAHAYPPMSTQLAELGVTVHAGHDPAQLDPRPDVVLIGNVMTRGNVCVEYVLDQGLPYSSGPRWLAEHVLRDRWVLAVAGTHGKTTGSSMLAWILEHAGLQPGFLIGGLPANFGVSARLGNGRHFVVEADEYDTAFFDKRSKFVHYRPRTLVLNNLEYDHADIFPDLASIQRQIHHLVRTVPGSGLIVTNADSRALDEALAMGCWTPCERFAAGVRADAVWGTGDAAGVPDSFTVYVDQVPAGSVALPLPGEHNRANAVAAVAAAHHAGVPVPAALDALSRFAGVRRRLEVRGSVAGITVYDDFAHHPTAIAATIRALRPRAADGRLIAVVEPRSNTMRLGVHRESLSSALNGADAVWLYDPGLPWSLADAARAVEPPCRLVTRVEDLVAQLVSALRPGDHVLIMSNGSFGGVHERLLESLRAVYKESAD